MRRGRIALCVLSMICVAAVGWAAQEQPQAKSPACLVLMHTAVKGKPKADARMKHFALPDPKLRARLKKLGFEVGVAPYAPGLDMDFLKQFNVVVVPHPYMPGSSPGLDGMARAKQQLLLDWVKAGGGLLVMRATGWQFGKDIDELNRWLKPCGIEILSEQVVDDQNKIKLESGYELSWTNNLTPHPVTKRVGGIFYTIYHHMYSDSTSPVKVSKDWTVLLRGMKTTKSLRTVKGGNPPPPAPGTYASEPPLLAVRQWGKGRIAVWPINATCVWQDGYHVLWGRGLTMDGKAGNMHGDAARLIENLMTWLAEPTRGRFGGFAPEPEKPKTEVGFVSINWDKARLGGPCPPKCFIGLIGAKSELSSGQGAPEDFIAAAQAAGYDFIGFTEDLDKLTRQKFDRLSKLCAARSTDAFKAYPGFEYLDDSGNAWATFSDRLRWPDKGWLSAKHKGRLSINNPLSRGCHWPPVILIKAHHNPEKPWLQGNFKVISLFTYEDGKLVDESVDYYRRLQWMCYGLAPVAVHIVRSPAGVKQAKANGFQTYVRWFDGNMADALSGHIGRYQDHYVWYRSSFVSNGPMLEDARILNFGTSDLAIPGNDRWRLHLQASSAAGLKEVALFDGDSTEPWRRFLPNGAKKFDKQIDHFHDRQYALIARVTDVNGKRAFGWGCRTGVQENNFARCSDNINTMPGGKWRGGPANMQNVRGIENYLVNRGFGYMGLPRWIGVEESFRPAVEYRPYLASRFVDVTDCRLYEHYPMSASANLNRTDQPECAVPNEYVTGVVRHTLFTPWQDDTLVMLVEGNLVAKKNFTMKFGGVFSTGGRDGADCVCATRMDGGILCGKMTERHGYYGGELPANGFAAMFYQPFRGSVGIIPLQDGLTFLAFHGGRSYYSLRGRLPGRDVKAGDKLTYRYLGIVSKLDPPPDIRFLTDVRDALGINGKTAYAITPQVGSIESTEFILRLKAQGCGFAGRITQAKLPLQLPTQIEGLNPRWHAGIWYPGKQTLTIAEWVVNDMNQRYTVRKKRAVQDEIQHFAVMPDGVGWLQIDTSVGDKDVFIGNLLVSDRPEVCLTLVDWRPGKAAFVVHNPTDAAISCMVRPGPGFTLLGEFSKRVDVPAGASVRVAIKG